MPFTPLPTALGALLLHVSATTHLLLSGRILGISSILSNAFFQPTLGDSKESYIPVLAGIAFASAVAYASGRGTGLFDFGYLERLGDLCSGGLVGVHYGAAGGGHVYSSPMGIAGIAGLLAGVGTYFSSGCTSGHMLCGLPRLSLRSLTSTLIFFPTAILTAKLLPISPPSSAGTTSHYIYHPTFLSSFTPPTPSSSPPWVLVAYTLLAVLATLIGNIFLPRFLNPTASQNSQKSLSISRALAGFWSGAVFALGLIISGMSDPGKVKGFLTIFPIAKAGQTAEYGYIFDPSLALVLVFAVLPNLLLWRLWRGKKSESKSDRPHGSVKVNHNSSVQGSSEVSKKAPTPEILIIANQQKPLLDEKWHVPSSTKKVDWRLIFGSIMFGVSWGLMGICPGPGFVLATIDIVRGVLNISEGVWGVGIVYVMGFLVGRGTVRVG